MKESVSNIFHVGKSPKQAICPPSQVFRNMEFEFSLFPGADFIEYEQDYVKFKKLLLELGEQSFTIQENVGASLPADENGAIYPDKGYKPYTVIFDINGEWKELKNKMHEFMDLGSLWYIHEWYLYGQSTKWGIYLSENPDVGIIGCDSSLSDLFRQSFGIIGNGYEQFKDQFNYEFEHLPELKREFCANYKI